uniref:uncharacterized protein n=2 Tax=Myxine glutinosa TaxID=7769 RepID=UPI00358E36FF
MKLVKELESCCLKEEPTSKQCGLLPVRFEFGDCTTMALIGNMGEFSEEKEDWMQYIERLQFFFLANGIVQEEQKRAILLTMIGPATFRLLKTLVAPRKVGEESFDNLVADMKNHLNPEHSEIIQRYKFNSRVRQPHESVAIFNAQMCKLAEHCNFGPILKDVLRDRLLSGINDEYIQRRLLLERGLTYTRALEIALEVESVTRDSRHQGAMASALALHMGNLATVLGNSAQLPDEKQQQWLQKVCVYGICG